MGGGSDLLTLDLPAGTAVSLGVNGTAGNDTFGRGTHRNGSGGDIYEETGLSPADAPRRHTDGAALPRATHRPRPGAPRWAAFRC
jgi:hypothetical protein